MSEHTKSCIITKPFDLFVDSPPEIEVTDQVMAGYAQSVPKAVLPKLIEKEDVPTPRMFDKKIILYTQSECKQPFQSPYELLHYLPVEQQIMKLRIKLVSVFDDFKVDPLTLEYFT